MRLELELQYAEFHPDEVEKIGPVELDQALKIIHSYPWAREFEKIDERTKQELTSTVPNVSIIRNKQKELLIVSARDTNSFIVEFITPTSRGELIVPHNSFDNKHGLAIEAIVSKFFDGTLKHVIVLQPSARAEAENVQKYKLKHNPLFLTGFAVGILALILILDFWANGLTPKALPAVYVVGFIILAMGFSELVVLHYILTDWDKEVSFEKDGALVIRQRGKEIRISKGDIDQVAIVGNDSHRTLRYYKYTRIKTKDGKAFVVTCFILDPFELVNRLRVNHKEESVFFPMINLDILSDKQKERIRRRKEKKKREFLERFKDYEDSRLKQIVGDDKNYADYAVEAAAEILKKRKEISTSK